MYWLASHAIGRLAIDSAGPVAGGDEGSGDGRAGDGRRQPRPMPLGRPVDLMATLLAGEVADELAHGRRSALLGTRDRASARRLAYDATGGDPVETALVLERAWAHTYERLANPRHRRLVDTLAAALLRSRTLDPDDVRRLLAAAPAGEILRSRSG
jgi:hypothetical protein